MTEHKETLDAVFVQDPRTGKIELRHRHCVGTDELIHGDSPSPMKPTGPKKCAACGEPINYETN